MARSAFLSHSHADDGFVTLLERVLRFHRIDVRRSVTPLEGGDVWQEETSRGIAGCDVLLVVVSRNAAESEWVRREVGLCLEADRVTRLVPLVLDDADTQDINVALADRQAIDFTGPMLIAFEQLLLVFGLEFLPLHALVLPDRRGPDEERREHSDRRANHRQRLRRELWTAYGERSGQGEFDRVRSMTELRHVRSALQDVLAPSTVVARATSDVVDMSDAVRASVESAYALFGAEPSPPRPIYYVEAVADILLDDYDVMWPGRREHPERRDEGEQR